MKQYTKSEIAKATGLSPRKIHYYTDFGLVVPGVCNACGRGTTRLYSERNKLEFLVVKKLSGFGFSLCLIKKIMKNLTDEAELVYSSGALYIKVCLSDL